MFTTKLLIWFFFGTRSFVFDKEAPLAKVDNQTSSGGRKFPREASEHTGKHNLHFRTLSEDYPNAHLLHRSLVLGEVPTQARHQRVLLLGGTVASRRFTFVSSSFALRQRGNLHGRPLPMVRFHFEVVHNLECPLWR